MKKLGKLSMPKKRMDEMDADLGLADEGMEESPDMEASEEDLNMDMEMAPEEGSNPDLEALSDDELLAEMKKRGLMGQMEEGEGEGQEMLDGEEDQSQYS